MNENGECEFVSDVFACTYCFEEGLHSGSKTKIM